MKSILSGLCMMLLAASAQAQMYKWVGPDGKITYSDTPPPKTATKVEKKEMSSGEAVDTGNMPFDLAEAVKSNPVTLYTGANCSPCEDARNHLNKRGIPFKEKTVATNADISTLREAGGDQKLPFITIGRNKLNGFEPGGLDSALTAAGYPSANKLPKNYSNPKAESAAPAPTKTAAGNGTANGSSRSDNGAANPPPPANNAPSGFRF